VGALQMKMTATCGIQKFRWREKNKTLVEILGVVNTGRPLQVKYWGVATPATPAALTPMLPTSRLYYKPGGNTRQTGKKNRIRGKQVEPKSTFCGAKAQQTSTTK